MQNGYVKSFNGCMRDELLNETLSRSLDHGSMVISPGQRITIIQDCACPWAISRHGTGHHRFILSKAKILPSLS